MKITRAQIELTDVLQFGWRVFQIRIGNTEMLMSLQHILHDEESDYDHINIASALREMADVLEAP